MLVNYGIYFERCYESIITGRTSIKDVARAIRETGVDRNILSTDLGQALNEPPPRCYARFIEQLMSEGFTRDEVEVMTKGSQRKLLYEQAMII